VRPEDPYFNTLLRIVATRCMSQAVYCVSGAHAAPERVHYGLAAPLYTHFTSPIRRYADVVVHRLLNAALGLEKPDASLQDGEALRGVAENINVRHRNSQMASRASTELHTHIFFRKRAAETEVGRKHPKYIQCAQKFHAPMPVETPKIPPKYPT
jgi:exosome complex exonuclease DIS3/RRP44